MRKRANKEKTLVKNISRHNKYIETKEQQKETIEMIKDRGGFWIQKMSVKDMKIGDNVCVNNTNSRFHRREGIIEDFENLQLRDKDSLILVRLKGRRGLDWFYGWELEKVEQKKDERINKRRNTRSS